MSNLVLHESIPLTDPIGVLCKPVQLLFFTSTLMTSSKVCPGLRDPWISSYVIGQTGILLVAHFW